mmetsp:Transcript_133522/g.198514  ORF Transcript_133522/g.198514 Transcript_133522/m.198514 type:complete len:250 (+) Transcript_133522:299-1048(+)
MLTATMTAMKARGPRMARARMPGSRVSSSSSDVIVTPRPSTTGADCTATPVTLSPADCRASARLVSSASFVAWASPSASATSTRYCTSALVARTTTSDTDSTDTDDEDTPKWFPMPLEKAPWSRVDEVTPCSRRMERTNTLPTAGVAVTAVVAATVVEAVPAVVVAAVAPDVARVVARVVGTVVGRTTGSTVADVAGKPADSSEEERVPFAATVSRRDAAVDADDDAVVMDNTISRLVARRRRREVTSE